MSLFYIYERKVNRLADTKSKDGERLLKITSKFQRRSQQKYISVPEIKLTGKWLQKIGFEEGFCAKIETFEKKIIITLKEKTNI